MTRVYASALFCSARLRLDVERLRQSVGNASDSAWQSHVERAYRCALAFAFNDFYRRHIRVSHVLTSRFITDGPLGEVWSDWVLLDDRRLATQTLHVSFCFPGLRVDLDDHQCPAIEALAEFLKNIYQLSEAEQDLPGGLAALSRLLCGVARGRQNALGISRYIYSSLACDDAEVVTEPSMDMCVNLYRLLYQHARGVDSAVAKSMLPRPWGSAGFFRLYSQPGGMVSVSTPYPADTHRRHDGWFNPLPPGRGEAPSAMAGDAEGQAAAYPSYDLLPEYPPLRYLAVPVLQYGAAYEETLREVHDAAFSRLLERRLRLPWAPKPGRCHLLAANLEGIRLPIVRSLLDEMIERQLQERTTNASMEMLRLRDTTRNIVLAVAGLILALAFVEPDKFVLHDLLAGRPAPAQPAPAVPGTQTR
ncbi:MAG: hypothetical protein KDH15_00815 [Rhodocyclaceae bacterium]|nr:hypothetical protein [Rhodocyclaceae bacterium]